MRKFTLPGGEVINLDAIESIGALFVNKTDSQFNCYEIHMTKGHSFGVFESDQPRAAFVLSVFGA